MKRYNRRSVNIITPASEPLFSPFELRSFLRTEAEDDPLVASFIEAATDAARQYLRRSLAVETLELRMDGFPGSDEDDLLALGPGVHTGHYSTLVSGANAVELPFGPVSSIVSVTTIGLAGGSSVFDAGNYYHDRERLVLADGRVWPTDLRKVDAIAIRYVSGEAVLTIPATIKKGIKSYILAMYECREGCEMPAQCRADLGPYRRMDMLQWS